MRYWMRVAAAGVLASGVAVGADGPMRVEVSRDTWVSSVGREAEMNLGGAPKLKTKSFQELSIVDLDPGPLRGRVIRAAALHVHCESKDVQRRVTVSTLASEWVEGTATSYEKQPGSTCFAAARLGEKPWAYPGSDMTAVMNGMGNTIWAFADATGPDKDGWQVIAVDPRVVAARVAGISYGFVVFDDVGSEYERNGDKVTHHGFPNRFIGSKDSNRRRSPYFTIELGEADGEAPGAIEKIESNVDELPAGEARVRWVTPGDKGPAGTLGFEVRVSKDGAFEWERAMVVPRYLIPMAGRAGETVSMRLRDMNLTGGAMVTVGVRAIDAAGNVGPVTTAKVKLSDRKAVELPTDGPNPFEKVAPLPKIGGVEVAVIDGLDKVQPITGEMVPHHEASYLAANHLWSAADKLVRLYAARNEFAAFQIVLTGKTDGVAAQLAFDEAGNDAPTAELFRLRNVSTKRGPMPDPMIPLKGAVSIPATDEKIDGQRSAAVLADVYVPHGAAAGVHHGKLTLTAGSETLQIAVELHVYDFTLPDVLSFVPELNCYGLPDPPREVAYYRMAHRNRTCLNRLPYGWNGSVSMPIGKWDGKTFDLSPFDARFGALLDGSAFDDLPRKGVPVDVFYLPLNENWPIAIDPAFKGGYWIEDALAPTYRQQFVAATRAFAAHMAERGYDHTLLEFYLNGKVYYKDPNWTRCSAPWIFDEPAHTQDFWALRWYGRAFHEAADPVRGNAKLAFRCDISRPQWQRDLLDGVLDIGVIGGGFRRYEREVIDRKNANGEVVLNYGSSNALEKANVQPAGWCIDTWTRGGDGVLPWQVIGNKGSWDKDDALSLFYPGEKVGIDGPVASIRLKSYRRGEQDVEYLTMLMQQTGVPRWAVGEAVRERLKLAASFSATSDEDAGTVNYDTLDPVALWALRTAIGQWLSERHPAPKRQLVDLRPAARDMAHLKPLGQVGGMTK